MVHSAGGGEEPYDKVCEFEEQTRKRTNLASLNAHLQIVASIQQPNMQIIQDLLIIDEAST